MKSRFTPSFVLAALLVLALFATACSSDTQIGDDPDNPAGNEGEGNEGANNQGGGSGEGTGAASQGVTVRIEDSGGQSGDTKVLISLDNASGGDDDVIVRETTVEGDPLGTGDVGQLLDRLPELEAEEADQVDYNRPPDTRPRPRPGVTVDQEFPPPIDVDAPETSSGPLQVLRFQPEGPVDLAPFISITFDQPMVALSTVSQVEAADVPITITPEMPGRWIWLGTKTVRFEYEPDAIDRIPAATNYIVEVPAGTASATGGELAEAVRFEFSTPTPQVQSVTPINQSLSTNPIFLIRFDQRINPEAVLGTVDMTVDGSEVAIRLASGDEINEDTQISSIVENALPDRWMVIRPVAELPTDAVVTIDIGPDVPSAEGPETNPDISSHSGRTYGPFEVIRSECGYGDGCRPGSMFRIEMSNPIDTETFSADMVSVEPPIPGLQIGVSWNQITVSGRTAGRTDYDVTISGELTDIFEQELGEEATERFRVGDAEPALFRPGRTLVTLDPIVDDQQLNVTSINNDELVVTTYRVDPAEDWQRFLENQWELSQGEFTSGWEQVSQRTIPTGGEANAFAETAIDLSSDLEANGHLVVVIGPERRRAQDYRNEPFAIWVQNTRLGLDAITDNANAIAWVTDLTTGEPVSNASVELIGGGSGTTDADGIARVALADRSQGMIAEADGDTALIGEFWLNGGTVATSFVGTSSTIAACTSRVKLRGSRAGCAGPIAMFQQISPCRPAAPFPGSPTTHSATKSEPAKPN